MSTDVPPDELQVIHDRDHAAAVSRSRTAGSRRASGPSRLKATFKGDRFQWWSRRAVVLLVSAVLGMLVGAAYGHLHSGTYEVSGEVQVSADVDLTGGQAVGQLQTSDVATQQALLNSQTVRLAARALVGDGLGTSATTTATDSSVISITVTAATPDLATKSLNAYLTSYLDLVAGQQQSQITSRLTVLDGRAQAADGQLNALDAAIAAAANDQRAALVGQQSAERSSAVAERLEDEQRAARLREALGELPVNVQRLSDQGVEPVHVGLALWQWAAAGALLAAGGTVLVLVRLAERRR